jgi:hypothetical protein
LEAALAKFDVKIISLIPGSIEVVPKMLDKNQVMMKVFERVLLKRAGRLPGLVIVMGGDETDTCMFSAAYDLIAQAPPQGQLQRSKCFTVSVGKRETSAQYYVNDVKVSHNSSMIYCVLYI